MRIKSRRIRVILYATTLLLILSTAALIVLLSFFDRLFLATVFKHLALSPSSDTFKSWLQPTVPIYFSVILFNLTNPQDVLNGGRPQLQEVGPFVYRETRERFDVTFSNESTPNRIRYKHRIFYHFQHNMSIGRPSDFKITTPDLFGMAAQKTIMSILLTNESPFITITAQEAMWSDMESISWFSQKKFIGLFASHNGTQVNHFVANTGATDIQNIGKLYEVDGQTKMSVWDHPEANMINGSDGSLAPPGMDIGSTVTFHVPGICRSLTMYGVDRKKSINSKHIEVIAFSPEPLNSSDPLVQWRTRMFCKSTTTCPPKGLVAMGPCIESKGASLPLFLSQPYFMGADPSVREPVDGLPIPSPEKHMTWVHIEPTTGLILEAFKRVQFNMLMNTSSSSTKPIYFPIAWITESVVVDSVTLDLLYNKLFKPRQDLPIFISITIGVAALFSLIGILAIVFCVRTRGSYPPKRDGTVCPGELDKIRNELKNTYLIGADGDEPQV